MCTKNRIISIAVLLCFVFNIVCCETALGFSRLEDAARNNLSPLLKCDGHLGIQHMDFGRIQFALKTELACGSELCTVEALVKKEESPYNPAGLQFFFNESKVIENNNLRVMVRIKDKDNEEPRTYYVIITILGQTEPEIKIYTDKEYKNFGERLERGQISLKDIPDGFFQKPDDARAVDRYVLHEENMETEAANLDTNLLFRDYAGGPVESTRRELENEINNAWDSATAVEDYIRPFASQAREMFLEIVRLNHYSLKNEIPLQAESYRKICIALFFTGNFSEIINLVEQIADMWKKGTSKEFTEEVLGNIDFLTYYFAARMMDVESVEQAGEANKSFYEFLLNKLFEGQKGLELCKNIFGVTKQDRIENAEFVLNIVEAFVRFYELNKEFDKAVDLIEILLLYLQNETGKFAFSFNVAREKIGRLVELQAGIEELMTKEKNLSANSVSSNPSREILSFSIKKSGQKKESGISGNNNSSLEQNIENLWKKIYENYEINPFSEEAQKVLAQVIEADEKAGSPRKDIRAGTLYKIYFARFFNRYEPEQIIQFMERIKDMRQDVRKKTGHERVFKDRKYFRLYVLAMVVNPENTKKALNRGMSFTQVCAEGLYGEAEGRQWIKDVLSEGVENFERSTYFILSNFITLLGDNRNFEKAIPAIESSEVCLQIQEKVFKREPSREMHSKEGRSEDFERKRRAILIIEKWEKYVERQTSPFTPENQDTFKEIVKIAGVRYGLGRVARSEFVFNRILLALIYSKHDPAEILGFFEQLAKSDLPEEPSFNEEVRQNIDFFTTYLFANLLREESAREVFEKEEPILKFYADKFFEQRLWRGGEENKTVIDFTKLVECLDVAVVEAESLILYCIEQGEALKASRMIRSMITHLRCGINVINKVRDKDLSNEVKANINGEIFRFNALLEKPAKIISESIGKEIPTFKNDRNTLYITDDFFAPGNCDKHKKKYGDRFNLKNISVKPEEGCEEKFVSKILDQAKGNEEKSIVLLPNTIPNEQLERLTNKGIRFMCLDIRDFLNEKMFISEEDLETVQENTYAMLLLARDIGKDKTRDPMTRELLACFLEDEQYGFKLPNGIFPEDYIEAMEKNDIPTLIKCYLSYKPPLKYEAHEYKTTASIFLSA
ncbi:MAG: hypothetical protein ABH844_01615 [Candidatus Omnitrophota bacterium]